MTAAHSPPRMLKFSIERYIGKIEKVAASGSERLGGVIAGIDIADDHAIVINSAAGAPTIPFDLAIDVGSASGYVVPTDYTDKVGGDTFNKGADRHGGVPVRQPGDRPADGVQDEHELLGRSRRRRHPDAQDCAGTRGADRPASRRRCRHRLRQPRTARP
jgi:hypothetical protein